jgi:hypothetical protein
MREQALPTENPSECWDFIASAEALGRSMNSK